MLMKKFEALEKEVMRQNNHLASSFTSSLIGNRPPNSNSHALPLAKNFEDAKKQHQSEKDSLSKTT